MLIPDVLPIIFRSLVIYFFILLAIRVFGKRELSQLSVVDLVFILLISNSVQNAMVGSDDTLLGGMVAAGTLFAANSLLENLIFRSKKFSSFLQGDPIMLIYKGKVLKAHLAKARIPLSELEAAIREHGVADVSEVDLAVLETDGNISVLSNDYQSRTSKRRHAHRIVEKNE